MISSVQNLIARRDLAGELIRADLRSGSAENRLGWLWWILDPLLMIGVYWFFKVLVFGRGTYAPYPIFVGVALLTWRHLSTSASRSVKVLRSSEALIKSVPFPTAVLPLSDAVSQFIYFCASMGVLTFVAIAIGQPITATLFQIPVLAVLQLMLIIGFTLFLAAVGVVVRDLEIAVGHALRIGWYLSPGIYGTDLVVNLVQRSFTEKVGSSLYSLYMMNPFAILFEGYRGALYHPAWLEPVHWGVLVVESLAVLIGGYMTFRYFDRRIIKFV
jgi:ABC-type polysaccharide/polyol phosphate export permease